VTEFRQSSEASEERIQKQTGRQGSHPDENKTFTEDKTMAGLSVLTNTPGIQAQNQLSSTSNQMQKTLFKLSSGLRITTGGDDAAGLSIADGLRAQINALSQSERNANDGISLLQIADGALGQITNLLNRAVTLAQQSKTDTVQDTKRAAIDKEYTEIKNEITRIATDTAFNGKQLLNGVVSFDIAVGDTTQSSTITIQTSSVTTTGLSITGSLASKTGAGTELTAINNAVSSVAKLRGTLGAYSNRLSSAVIVIGTQVQNLTAAESGIRDANMATEVSNMTKWMILNQSGMAALAQANSQAQSVMSLFR
jgi:flagellin